MAENKELTPDQIRQEVLLGAPAPRMPQIPSSVTASILVNFLNSDLTSDFNVQDKFPKKYGSLNLAKRVTDSMKRIIREQSLPVVAYEHDKYGACLARWDENDGTV